MAIRFAIKVVVFCLLLGGLIFGLIVRHNPYLYTQERYDAQMRRLMQKGPTYILLGDSQSMSLEGDPLWPRSIFNASFGSDGVNEMYIKLGVALRHNPDLKGVFVNAGDHIFAQDRQGVNNWLFIKPYADRALYKEIFHAEPQDRLFCFLTRRFPMLNPNIYVFSRQRLVEKIMGLWSTRRDSVDNSVPWGDEKNKFKRLELAARRAHDTLSDAIIVDEFVANYRKLLELGHKHHVRVIGVRYPVSLEYTQEKRKYAIDKVQALFRQMPFDQFLDYTHLIESPSYYFNPDHLNEEGGAILVKQLKTDMKL
ncbi:MAG: SGNH/GDSL hydrolase family protein [Candidatus Omnitrophica bacterium]|nr:SGNH/GDSL hydrolase family protein [Candidatus Omnitrophota bacterium]